jgi:hypothetical protein
MYPKGPFCKGEKQKMDELITGCRESIFNETYFKQWVRERKPSKMLIF